MFDQKGVDTIKALIRLYDLPADMPDDIAIDDIISAMEIDKKVKAGKLNFILPESIGRVHIVEDVDRAMIKEMLEPRLKNDK